MANEETEERRAPSFSPIPPTDSENMAGQEREPSHTTISSGPSAHEVDNEWNPGAVLRNQASGVQNSRKLRPKRAVIDDEDEDEDESGPHERSTESKKRKASVHQQQAPAKKQKTPGEESTADDSVIMVAHPSKKDSVVPTTETEEPKQSNAAKERKEDSASSDQPQNDESKTGEAKMIPEEKLEELRARANKMLNKKKYRINELEAQLEQAEQDRDTFQEENLALKVQLDRMIPQEVDWLKQTMPKLRNWSKNEINSKVVAVQEKYDSDLAKAKNAMDKKYKTQEDRHTREREDKMKKATIREREARESKKEYEDLQKELRRDTEREKAKMKPEYNKEVKAKQEQIVNLKQQVKQLHSEIEQGTHEHKQLHDYAVGLKSERSELRGTVKGHEETITHSAARISRLETIRQKLREEKSLKDQQHGEQMQKIQQAYAIKIKECEESNRMRIQLQRSAREFADKSQLDPKTLDEFKSEKSRLEEQVKCQDAQLEKQRTQIQEQKAAFEKQEARFQDRIKTLESNIRALTASRASSRHSNTISPASPQQTNEVVNNLHQKTQASPSVGHHQQPGNAPRANPTYQGGSDKGGVGHIASQEQSISTKPTKDPATQAVVPFPAPSEAKEIGAGKNLSAPRDEGGKEAVAAVADVDGARGGGDKMEGARLEGVVESAGARALQGPDPSTVGEYGKRDSAMAVGDAGSQVDTTASVPDSAEAGASATNGQQPGLFGGWPSPTLPWFSNDAGKQQ